MAVNLALKYSGKIAERFSKESYVLGRASTAYDFVGVRTVRIYTPRTVPLNNYDRTASANRFGTPVEMQDDVQELQLSQDVSFSMAIDRGNNEDQMNVKGAAKMLKMQIRDEVTPFIDKYSFAAWANNAGKIAAPAATLTKSNIVEEIMKGLTVLENGLVPSEGRTIYVPASNYNLLRLAPEFANSDHMANNAILKGFVGMLGHAEVVMVPDSYLAEGDEFLITHKSAVLVPNKIKTARILDEVPGIDGNLLEGRNYFDAFVLGAKADGIYACSSNVTGVTTIAISSNAATVTAASGGTAFYTTDGSDPRYSASAQVYASAVTLEAGQVIKAATKKSGRWGAVATATNS